MGEKRWQRKKEERGRQFMIDETSKQPAEWRGFAVIGTYLPARSKVIVRSR
jgi:hypothetical protein